MISRKGVSLYISHVIGLALMLTAFGLITLNMVNYYTSVSEETQEAEAVIIAQALAQQIVELEAVHRETGVQPANNGTNITLADITMPIPTSLGGKPYSIELLPREEYWVVNNVSVAGIKKTVLEEERPYSRIVIMTDGLPSITFTYDIYNVLVKTEGSARHTDRIRLKYIRERVDSDTVDKIIFSGV